MCTQCTQSTLCVPSRPAQALIYNLSICLLSLLLWTLSSSAYQQWKLSYFVARERVLRGKCHQSRFFPLLKVPTHVRCACGCLTCKGVFGCFSRSRFSGAYFKIERFRLKLWILTLIPGKMNAVSVPSPSHFVKHLSPLWHTCTLPQQFAHCDAWQHCGTDAHITAHHKQASHFVKHSRTPETLEETRNTKRHTKTRGHSKHLRTPEETQNTQGHNCKKILHSTDHITWSGQKTLYPCITQNRN